MTRINKIVMTGFKSFAKRTEFVFGDNFNIILGPNGSGKSNLIDGLCFVLGRMSSKSLRAEKTSHLIYNGGKKNPPATKAEVAIVFDNSKKTFPLEEELIKIARAVKPNGQSIYRINDQRRTRQQIIELLSAAKIEPYGYNIILQGDITRFCEMSSEERRQIIEEIAGISIYEDRKQKALNELNKVEEHIKEADILLTERKTHLKELKKDRDQALKYKDLSDRIKQNKATNLHLQIEEKGAQHEKIKAGLKEYNDQIKATNDEIEELKKEIEEKKQQISSLTKEIEEKGEKDQLSLNKAIEELRVSIATKQNRTENCKKEIEKIEARREQLRADSKELEEKISQLLEEKKELEKQKLSIQKDLSVIEKSIASFKKSEQHDQLVKIEKEVEVIDKKAEQEQEEAQKLSEQKQNLIREKDKLELQILSIDERVQKIEEIEKENKKELDELKNKRQGFKQLVLELNKLLNESSTLSAELANAKAKLAKADEELAGIRAKDLGIKAQISSNLAVKKIVEQKKSIKGIFGTVSELGQVKSQYATALQVAAGPRINSIVVESDEVAAKCIKYLKTNKLGVATFLPLNKLKTKPIKEETKKLLEANGVQGLAVDFITFESRFKKVFSYVFGDTLVVDNIDAARRIGIGSARMVSLDGDLADKSGAMHGGYRKKTGAGFKEEVLSKELFEREKRVEESEQLVKVLEKTRAENDELINQLRQKKSELEGEIIKTERGLHLESADLEVSKKQKEGLKQKLSEVEAKLNSLQTKISECTKGLAELKLRRQKLREEISKLRDPAMLAELNTFEQKRSELLEQRLSIENQIKNADVQANELYEQERKKILQLTKQLDKDKAEFSSEQQQLKEEIIAENKQLKEMEKQNKLFISQYKELFTRKDAVKEQLQEIEEKLIRKEEGTRLIEVKLNNTSLRNAEVSAELSALEKEFEQYSDVELFKTKRVEEIKSEISRYERLLIEMGNVNLKALEVYDEVEKQYNSLLKKNDTLAKEKNDVLVLINEIETKKKELFMNTFNIITENFKQIFQSLSTKGEAQLLLENEEQPFEGGVKIRVRLTGNKFLDIRSLSGGEKTLTALAFIFAIQEHEPASFYVLDEVDASLDKRNSEKFAGLIRKYAEKAQYIIISHNDAVVSEASNLYGVSMDEHGISNVVSLKI